MSETNNRGQRRCAPKMSPKRGIGGLGRGDGSSVEIARLRRHWLKPASLVLASFLVCGLVASVVSSAELTSSSADTGETVSALIEALGDENWNVRYRAAGTLGHIGAEAKAAVPALIEALGDENLDAGLAAALALGEIGAEVKAVVPALIEALGDEDTDVRGGAAHALGEIGAEARAAVPGLIEALGDEDGGVRRSAANALGEIDPEAIPAMVEAIGD